MTYKQKQLLKTIAILTDRTEQTFFYDPDNQCFSLYDTDKNINARIFSGQISGVVNDLESKKYIKFLPTYGADYQNMCLTYKGLHYWYFTFEKMVSFLFKSVVVPIVVSVITTVITLYIKG